MEDAEALAREKGRRYVMDVLKRPEQLEKVAKYQRQVALKKASVDASVKTALQSQLDGVRKGLELLQTALSDAEKVKTGLEGFETNFHNLPKLDEIKEENRRHSQFVTAKDNLKNIFSVPEYVTKTKDWINEGKLLFAAKSLAELENSRDDLMFELYKQNASDSESEMALLSFYFEEVTVLSTLMEKQIRLVLARTLNTVRKDPTIIVTALRVVEQEEVRDAKAAERQKNTGFVSPNRPKRWRAMAMGVLKSTVDSRIEGTQTDEREDDKMWLVRHLELTRQLITEDLQVVRTLCVPCFPPDWKILESFKAMYHSSLRAHIEEMIANKPVGNELVTLLGWVLNTYTKLDLPHPLLPEKTVKLLQDNYLDYIKKNLMTWLGETLKKEKDDWEKFVQFEEDSEVFISPAPAIIGQMVEQNLIVARTISPKLTSQVLQLCTSQIAHYADEYAMAVKKLRDDHFKDRSINGIYTQQMIAVLNNCVALNKAAMAWSGDGRQHTGLLKVRDVSIHYLLQEPFSDLKPQFDGLFSGPWFQGPNASIDTICVTFEDYFGDYKKLYPENLSAVVNVAQSKIARVYIFKIIQGDIQLKTYQERKAATYKIRSEVMRIQKLFRELEVDVPGDPGFNLIEPLTEIIRSEDPEMLILDLHRLVEVYPAITEAQLSRLLQTRRDMNNSEIVEIVASALSSRKEVKDTRIQGYKAMLPLLGLGNQCPDWDNYWACLINPP